MLHSCFQVCFVLFAVLIFQLPFSVSLKFHLHLEARSEHFRFMLD